MCQDLQHQKQPRLPPIPMLTKQKPECASMEVTCACFDVMHSLTQSQEVVLVQKGRYGTFKLRLLLMFPLIVRGEVILTDDMRNQN